MQIRWRFLGTEYDYANGRNRGVINRFNRCEGVILTSLFLLAEDMNMINRPLLLILVKIHVRQLLSAN